MVPNPVVAVGAPLKKRGRNQEDIQLQILGEKQILGEMNRIVALWGIKEGNRTFIYLLHISNACENFLGFPLTNTCPPQLNRKEPPF